MKKLIFLTVLLMSGSAHAATLSIDIPNAIAQRVLDDFTGNLHYQATIKDPNDPTGQGTIPNPETETQFAVRMIKLFIRQQAISYEQKQAGSSAGQAIILP